MYCTVCGRETSGLINYCSSCGYRLTPTQELRYATSASSPTEINSQQLLTGVGGWLLCFCILITVVAPLLLFTDWHADRMVFVRTMFGVVTGIMVWSVRPTALHWLRGYFAVSVVTRIAALILIGSKAPAGGASWFEDFTRQCIGLVGLIAWFAYFNYSARVRATFGSNL